jgi:hypothetical protein
MIWAKSILQLLYSKAEALFYTMDIDGKQSTSSPEAPIDRGTAKHTQDVIPSHAVEHRRCPVDPIIGQSVVS